MEKHQSSHSRTSWRRNDNSFFWGGFFFRFDFGFFHSNCRLEYRPAECNYPGWNLAKTLGLTVLLFQNMPQYPKWSHLAGFDFAFHPKQCWEVHEWDKQKLVLLISVPAGSSAKNSCWNCFNFCAKYWKQSVVLFPLQILCRQFPFFSVKNTSTFRRRSLSKTRYFNLKTKRKRKGISLIYNRILDGPSFFSTFCFCDSAC